MSRTILGLSLLFPLILSSPPALGWADVGHRVVCEVAFRELTDDAKSTVKRLVAAHPDFGGFAEACTWPDGRTRERKDEHYANVPRHQDEIRAEACHLADRCLFSAIRKDSGEVADESRADEDRAESLAYLAHWIGDIHQPLHVSFKDDKGGNDIGQSGAACEGNLHLVWDLCIIDNKLGSDSRAIARSLRRDVTRSQREDWRESTVVDWADESYRIATREGVSYCVPAEGGCWYDAGRERLDPGAAKKTVPVDDAYIDRQFPVVRERLQQAGIRLGAILNDLLDPTERAH